MAFVDSTCFVPVKPLRPCFPWEHLWTSQKENKLICVDRVGFPELQQFFPIHLAGSLQTSNPNPSPSPIQVGSGGGFPETFRDLHLALQWLRTPQAAELIGPAAPLALLGHSAGGHLATWLGLQQGLEKPMFSKEVGDPGVRNTWV